MSPPPGSAGALLAAERCGDDGEGCGGLDSTGDLTAAELETTGELTGVDRLGCVELSRCDGVELSDSAGVLETGLLGTGWLDGGVETGTLVEMVGEGWGGMEEPSAPAQSSRMSREVTTAPSRPITRTW